MMIVLGNLERAQRLSRDHEGSGDERLRAALTNAMEGADRAAKLTQQLLAFSRRQTLQPSREDLSAIVGDMSALLQRTLGARYELIFHLETDLPEVVVDRLQTENVLLNLALNARDALPDGGQIRFTTTSEGSTVVLAVSDDGIGMSEDVKERIFEPFFTTKPLGQGTGLGMSQVYGFTKQSGGDITVESAPGKGTTIRLVLPQEHNEQTE
jgi:signal transduction histidine kinase